MKMSRSLSREPIKLIVFHWWFWLAIIWAIDDIVSNVLKCSHLLLDICNRCYIVISLCLLQLLDEYAYNSYIISSFNGLSITMMFNENMKTCHIYEFKKQLKFFTLTNKWKPLLRKCMPNLPFLFWAISGICFVMHWSHI